MNLHELFIYGFLGSTDSWDLKELLRTPRCVAGFYLYGFLSSTDCKDLKDFCMQEVGSEVPKV